MNTSISAKDETYYIPVGNKLINPKVLSAFIICSVLVITGTIRVLSYSRNSLISAMFEGTLFHHFAYRPEDYLNVSFFKILATPSIMALIYFLFRGLNNGGNGIERHKINNDWRKVDFKPSLFRLCLTTMIMLCWIPMEIMKFHFGNAFYPYSELEDPFINIIVLTGGGILCFFLMKYLPFGLLIITKK